MMTISIAWSRHSVTSTVARLGQRHRSMTSCDQKMIRRILIRDWVHCAHPEAHLIEHARRQYETSFSLAYSSRPWAKPLTLDEVQLGCRVGYVWHARWYFKGGQSFDLAKFWRDIAFQKDLIIPVCADSGSSLSSSQLDLPVYRREYCFDTCFS